MLLQDAAGTSGRGSEAGGARGRVSQGPARAGGPQAAAVGPEAVDAALLKPMLAGAGAKPGRRWGRAHLQRARPTKAAGTNFAFNHVQKLSCCGVDVCGPVLHMRIQGVAAEQAG